LNNAPTAVSGILHALNKAKLIAALPSDVRRGCAAPSGAP